MIAIDRSPSTTTITTATRARPVAYRAVAAWLFLMAGLIFMMALIGAITRLTESGLSIMDWHLLLGSLPPLSAEAWQAKFQLYQQTGEFAASPIDMARFKSIYWWEYIHRLWGRLLGLVYIAGLLLCALRWQVRGWRPWGLLLLGLIFGGAQGAVGWFMVLSGFDPELLDVSAYRLVMHLGAAFLLYAYIIFLALAFWTAAEPRRASGSARPARSSSLETRLAALFLLLFCFVTLLSGGFVAGLDAGAIMKQWPGTGSGAWAVDYQWQGLGFWRNAFENPAAAQMHHRLLTQSLAVVCLLWGLYSALQARPYSALNWLGMAIAGVAVLQTLLGIVTLLSSHSIAPVDIALGTAHQGGAFLLFGLVCGYCALAWRAQLALPKAVIRP